MKLTAKQQLKQGYVRIYCYNFGISDEVTEMLLELILEPKWIGRTDKQIQRIIERLKEFTPEYQKVLIQTTLDNNYQGLIFPDSKEKEQKYYANRKETITDNIQRLERLTAIRNNQK